MTDLGDLEESDWIQRATALIEQFGEQQLYDNLLLWHGEHNYTKSTAKELRMQTLQSYVMRIFDSPAWVDYIPWNRRFRPGFLDESRLIWIETECCHSPDQVTQEQINKAYDNRVCCPHCGRFSAYILCHENRKENAHECE